MRYHYSTTGVFTGRTSEGDTLPPLSTDVPPPQVAPPNEAVWAGDRWVVRAPITLPPPRAAATISRFAFRNRFTIEERENIEIASLDVPASPVAQRKASARLRVFQTDILASQFVDLSRADVRAGVQALEAAGLIGAGRAAQILDAPVQYDEQP